jgi:hypothetical protein
MVGALLSLVPVRSRKKDHARGSKTTPRHPEAAPVVPLAAESDIPPELFESLVSLWEEILYAHYIRRHPEQADAL